MYNSSYAEKYAGSGKENLIDGLVGSENHNDGYWQGWERKDMQITVDLHKNKKINTIICGFLESHQSWIFLPKSVSVSFSSDGKNFVNEKTTYVARWKKLWKIKSKRSEIPSVKSISQIYFNNSA